MTVPVTASLKRGQRGFSLLEVLVAFVVLTLSLGVILKIFSDGMRSVELAEQTAYAVALAQSQLAAAAADPALPPGRRAGEDAAHYRWEIAIQPAAAPPTTATPAPAAAPVRLMEVTVTVAWGAAPHLRTLSLSTLRVQSAPLTLP